MIQKFFSALNDYLPVVVPLLLALLAIVARFTARSRPRSLGAALKMHTDVALGLLSFLVWGLITLAQTNQIALNPYVELTKGGFILVFLLDLNVIWAAQAVAGMDWQNSKAVGGIRGWFTAKRKEPLFDGVMLALTVLFFFLPILIASAIPKPSELPRSTSMYVVVVPFHDPSIGSQLGRERWGYRRVCEVEFVRAFDPEAAETEAIKRVRESGRLEPLFPEKATATTLQNQYVVAKVFQ